MTTSSSYTLSNVSSMVSSVDAPSLTDSEPSIFDFVEYSNSAKVEYEEFKNLFADFYGERLTHEVECEYGRYDGKTITVREIKQRLISAAALVKREDLEDLFDAIHGGDDDLDCILLLSEEELKEVRKATNFDKLNNKQLGILMSVYRYFPNNKGDLQAIGSLLFPLKKLPSLTKENKLFHKHLTMIRAFERADHFVQDKGKKNFAIKQKLAAAEHLSREIAYGVPLNKDLEEQIKQIKRQDVATHAEIKQAIEDLVKKEVVGTIFPALNDRGEKVYYEIKGSVFENGLVCFFCTPLTAGQWKKKEDSPYPLLAYFRGTWCASSLKRDLTEGMEAGKNSFFGLSPTIIDRLIECLPDDVDNIHMELGGHSLGGLDAARLAALLAKLRVERIKSLGEDYTCKLDNIRSVHLVTWNSPGVLKNTCRDYNANRAAIKKTPILPLSFRHTHVKVGEDAFQNFGRALLGWQDPKLTNKKQKSINCHQTKVVKFSFKKFYMVIGTTWFAHRLPCLSVEAKPTRMKIRRGKINYKLGPRSLWRWIKLIARAIFRRTSRIPIAICKMFKKEAQKDYHKIYKALAIKKVFVSLPAISAA